MPVLPQPHEQTRQATLRRPDTSLFTVHNESEQQLTSAHQLPGLGPCEQHCICASAAPGLVLQLQPGQALWCIDQGLWHQQVRPDS